MALRNFIALKKAKPNGPGPRPRAIYPCLPPKDGVMDCAASSFEKYTGFALRLGRGPYNPTIPG